MALYIYTVEYRYTNRQMTNHQKRENGGDYNRQTLKKVATVNG